jgi:hypothetical protein
VTAPDLRFVHAGLSQAPLILGQQSQTGKIPESKSQHRNVSS